MDLHWYPRTDSKGLPVIQLRFSVSRCGPCPDLRSCVNSATGRRRKLVLLQQHAEHDAIRTIRAEQQTDAWKERYKSEEAYLSGLRRKERQSVQAARRHLDEAGLTVDVVPVTGPFLDEFLDLYKRQLTRLRHALPVALQQRDQLLAPAANLFAVRVRDGDALTGACLSQDQPEADLVRLRFSAVNERARAQSLARVLYMEAVNHAPGPRLRQGGFVSELRLWSTFWALSQFWG